MFRSGAVDPHGTNGWRAGDHPDEVLDGLARGRLRTIRATHGEPGGQVGEVGEHLDERTDLVKVGNRLDREQVWP